MAKKVTTSPVPTKSANPHVPGHLTFAGIVQPLLDGKKVTKLEWQNRDIYLVLKDGKLTIHKADTKMLHPLIVTDGDLAGTDFVVLE